MKLIGNLKKQIEQTESKEEAKAVIEKAGMELNDDELDQVAGGLFVSGDQDDTFCAEPPVSIEQIKQNVSSQSVSETYKCNSCGFRWQVSNYVPNACPVCSSTKIRSV